MKDNRKESKRSKKLKRLKESKILEESKRRDNPLFTIVTACQNGEQFVNTWMSSILEQKYRPLEVSVCDDSSSDRTVQQIMNTCLPQFKKFDISFSMRVNTRVHNYGGSLSSAIVCSKGSFFGILDIDDTITEDAVLSVMKVYDKYPEIGHVYTQFDVYDCDMNFKKHGFSRLPRKGSNILDEGWSYGEHIYSHFRTFSKRVPEYYNVIQKCRYAVDQYTGMVLEERSPGAFLDKVCYKYRAGCPGSISSTLGAQRREFWYKLMEMFLKKRQRKKIRPFPIVQVEI